MSAVITRVNLALISALCLAVSRAAASGPGTSAADFLRIPAGARETALGGAMTAVPAGANSVFYNPAGLGPAAAGEFAYSYNNYFSGISQQCAAAALPYGGGTFGLGINFLDVASFDAYDANDNSLGSVSAYGLAAQLAYGRDLETGFSFLPSLSYGATLKYISEKLASRRASGYGLDAGLLLRPGLKHLTLGFAAENLAASRLEFIAGGARPLRSYRAGAAYLLGDPDGDIAAQLSLDVNFPEGGARYLAAGLENTLYGAVSLRAGYTAFGDLSNGLSFGVGLVLPGREDVRLDYSYGSSYDLGNVHKFGLAFRFGRARAKAAAVSVAPGVVPGLSFKTQLPLLYEGTAGESLLAAEYLARLPDERVPEHFISLLYSQDLARRLAAVHGLSLRKDRRSLEGLGIALRDQEPELRRRAAEALGLRGDAAASGLLQEALRSEEAELVKNAIIAALGKLRPGRD